MDQTKRICFIGAGHMGASLIAGLVQAGYPADNIYAASPAMDKLERLREHLGINIFTDNKQAANHADVIVLAVKPQTMAKAISQMGSVNKNTLVISIAAGVQIQQINQWLGGDYATVRCMPNTPALIGCGASGLFATNNVSPEQREMSESLMRSVGVTVWLDKEEDLNTVTALSGNGPAYFFLIMETLQESAEKLGLSYEAARLLILQTALGSAKMAFASEEPLYLLRQQVTSPGGTTEAALESLENANIRKIFSDALLAAKRRANELAQQRGDE